MLKFFQGVPFRRSFLRAAAWLLVALRFYNKAESLLERWLEAYPTDRILLIQYALIAHRARRHEVAILRWLRCREARSETPQPWWGVSYNLRALGRHAEADAFAMEGHERFPNDNWLIEQAAIAADGRYSYEEALRLWRRLIKLRKVEPSWLQRYAHNLTSLGRFDEAGEILVRARRKHPRHVGLEIGEGILAAAKEDWMPAIDILSRFQAREPDNPAARELLGRVLQLRALAAINSVALQPLEPVDVGRSEDKMVCNLLLCFESLGYDCEFGLVQRHYGGEPLGFLRWNTTTTIGLLLGLASQFEAVGCAEHLTLTCDPESSLYYLHDARFDLQIHTFLSKGQIDEHKLIERMSKVLRYLRDKFFDDLRAGEKIFVYSDPDCDLEFIFALKTALARYQPSVRLLWVMPIDVADTIIRAANNAGDVAKIGENLFVGFLSRAGGIDGVWDIAFEEWIAICQKTKVLASDRLT